MARRSTGLASEILLSAALAVLLAGCASPHKRVAQHIDTLEAAWVSNVTQQAQLPQRTLDWSTALAEMQAGNLKLRQVRTDLTNAQEAVRQIFRDLAPTLNLHAGLSKRIVDLPSIGVNDVSLNVDSFFNIPDLFNFNARLYVARLYKLRAEAAAALTERQQIIELYKLFLAAQDTQEQARHLSNQKKIAQAYETVDPFSGQLLLTQTELRKLADQRETDNLQQRASDLLGRHDYHWAFVTNGLPQLRYDVDPLDLADTNRVARLQIRLTAIELEAARAELAGIKLRYWPQLNIYLVGPPLYQRYAGQEKFWDAKNVQLNADLFWFIDTRGQVSRQLRQTKRQQEMQRERLHQEALALIQKLLVTQSLLSATQEKARDLQQQLFVLEAVPPAQNLAALQKYGTDYQATADQLRQAQHELAELNSLFWFVDEAAWTELSPLTPLAASR